MKIKLQNSKMQIVGNLITDILDNHFDHWPLDHTSLHRSYIVVNTNDLSSTYLSLNFPQFIFPMIKQINTCFASTVKPPNLNNWGSNPSSETSCWDALQNSTIVFPCTKAFKTSIAWCNFLTTGTWSCCQGKGVQTTSSIARFMTAQRCANWSFMDLILSRMSERPINCTIIL